MLSLRSPEGTTCRRIATLAVPLALLLAACGSNNDQEPPVAEPLRVGEQTGETDTELVFLENGNMVIHYVGEYNLYMSDIVFSCLPNRDVVYQNYTVGDRYGNAGNAVGYIENYQPCADGKLTPSDYAGK